MDSLILIGIILFVAVLSVDCVVRLVIVWNMRKRKRAVKPLGVRPIEQNDDDQVDENDNGDGDGNGDDEENGGDDQNQASSAV